MARIRSIKPELLEDERTARLTHLQWRLFVSCILLADDYGNFRAVPERIVGAAFWAHPGEDLGSALDHLAKVGLLQVYTADGQSYAHITGWDKHQKVDHKGKPSCPPQPSRESRETVAGTSRPAVTDRETLAPDLDLKGEDKERKSPPDLEPKIWPPGRWLAKFKIAWEARGVPGKPVFYADTGDSRALETLTRELGRLPNEVRSGAQADSSAMFALFLGSTEQKTKDRGYPFIFFVQEFGALRIAAAKKRPGVSVQRPPGDLPAIPAAMKHRPTGGEHADS